MLALVLLLTLRAQAAAPGITGSTFYLTAGDSYLTQPDGRNLYSWGYGCDAAHAPAFLPAMPGNRCDPTMQVPGPTLIVTEGDSVSVTLTNHLPAGRETHRFCSPRLPWAHRAELRVCSRRKPHPADL